MTDLGLDKILDTCLDVVASSRFLVGENGVFLHIATLRDVTLSFSQFALIFWNTVDKARQTGFLSYN